MGISFIVRKTLPLLALLLAVSCARPVSDEFFTKVSAKPQSGRYVFELALEDADLAYDVDIYIPCASDRRSLQPFSEDVLMEWQAPSGTKYQETVVFSSDTQTQESFFSRTYLYHYREGLVPVEHGTWILRMKFPSDFEKKNKANGIGVRLIRNNGTR